MIRKDVLRPNDISSRILEDNSTNIPLGEFVEFQVKRFQKANAKEQRNVSTDMLRRQILANDPSLKPEQVDAILRHGMKSRTSSGCITARSPTAADLRRKSRKAGVRSRRNARL